MTFKKVLELVTSSLPSEDRLLRLSLCLLEDYKQDATRLHLYDGLNDLLLHLRFRRELKPSLVTEFMLTGALCNVITQTAIICDLLAHSEEDFLALLSELCSIGFDGNCHWLLKEAALLSLTELESVYPGVLVTEMSRLCKSVSEDRFPSVQAGLALLSLSLRHCMDFGYSTYGVEGPRGRAPSVTKLTFKYVISYRAYLTRTTPPRQLKLEDQMQAMINERMKLCTPLVAAFIYQILPDLIIELERQYPDDSLSSSCMPLLFLLNSNMGRSSRHDSLLLLTKSPFISNSLKTLLSAWILYSRRGFQDNTVSSRDVYKTVFQAQPVDSLDAVLQQFTTSCIAMNFASDAAEGAQVVQRIVQLIRPADTTKALTALFRGLAVWQLDYTTMSPNAYRPLCQLLLRCLLRVPSDKARLANQLFISALDSFNSFENEQSISLVETVCREFDTFCFSASKPGQALLKRALNEFLPSVTKFAVFRKDLDKRYISCLPQLAVESSFEDVTHFVEFFAAFLSSKPSFECPRDSIDSFLQVLATNESHPEEALLYSELLTKLFVVCSSPLSKPLLEDLLVENSSEGLKLELGVSDALQSLWTVSVIPRRDRFCAQLTAPINILADLPNLLQSYAVEHIASANSSSPASPSIALFVLSYADIFGADEKICFGVEIQIFCCQFGATSLSLVGQHRVPLIDLKDQPRQLYFDASSTSSSSASFQEKWLFKVSLSTSNRPAVAGFLKPLTFSISDMLIPFQWSPNADEFDLASCLERDAESILGWTYSIYRLGENTNLAHVQSSVFAKFIVQKGVDESSCVLAGCLPEMSALLFVVIKFSIECDLSEDEPPTSFAFIYTNNSSILQHIFHSLRATFG